MKTIGGLDPFFFLLFPSAAVAVYCSLCDPPLLPPSTFCGSRNASMFPTELPQRTVPDVSETSPGLCWCKVGENGVGGVALPGGPGLTDQSASELQYELLSVPRLWCPRLSVELCV